MSDSVRPHRWQPTRLHRPWNSAGKNTGVDCHFLLQCIKVKSESEVAQSCPTLSDPMDCSLPGSSIHVIFQARVLEWGAIVFSNNTVQIDLKIFENSKSLKILGSFLHIYFEVLLTLFHFGNQFLIPCLLNIHLNFITFLSVQLLTYLWMFLTTLIGIKNKIP